MIKLKEESTSSEEILCAVDRSMILPYTVLRGTNVSILSQNFR